MPNGISRPAAPGVAWPAAAGALRRLTLAATVIAAVAVAPAASPAAAAPSPFGYALEAQGFQSYFVYHSRPGGEARGTVRLINLNSTPKTIVVKAVDVGTASGGGLQYGVGAPHGDGRWLHLNTTIVHLAPGGSADDQFSVKVPRPVANGEHFLGIVAVDRRVLEQRPSGHGHVLLKLVPRLAMTVEVTLPGPLSSSLKVGGAKIAITPAGASAAIRLSNPGNALLPSATGELAVYQGARRLFTQPIRMGAFVPRTSILYHVPWRGKPVQGGYQLRGFIRPAYGHVIRVERTVNFGSENISDYRRETGRPAIASSGTPTILLVALGVALAAAVALALAFVTTRRKLAGAR